MRRSRRIRPAGRPPAARPARRLYQRGKHRRIGGLPVSQFEQLRVALGDFQHRACQHARGLAFYLGQFAFDEGLQMGEFADQQQRLLLRQRVHRLDKKSGHVGRQAAAGQQNAPASGMSAQRINYLPPSEGRATVRSR